MRRAAIHPAVFLGGAVLLCASWLWVRSIRDADAPAGDPPLAAETRLTRDEVDVDAQVLERCVGRDRIAYTRFVVLASGRRLTANRID
jgi:hypothetical protein